MAVAVPPRSASTTSSSSSSWGSARTVPNETHADITIEGQLVKPRSFRRTASGLVDCHRVLTHTFGYDVYKGRQKEIVEAAVRGADVLVVAPTGMGKSLCFQIPAIADKYGVSIVVSPLLALMSNQVQALKEKGVQVAKLSSETSAEERVWITKDLSSGHPHIRLLYITPEKLASADFTKLMHKICENQQVMRLVVDEAHCIAEWGWDFRPEYRSLGNFREKFPEVPIMALTASATKTVQDDIVSSLKMSSEHLLRVIHPFNRKNLFYEVKYVVNPEPHLIMEDMLEFILKLSQKRREKVPLKEGEPELPDPCGIIYCRTRKDCDLVAGFLRRKGISAQPYHRGVRNDKLATTLTEWLDDKVSVVVATVAFGMGIDKKDVRYILHYDLPKSFEGYYQETGRAGRDDKLSRCVLYYSRSDAFKVRQQVQQDFAKRLRAANRAPAPSQRAPRSMEMLMRMVEDVETCRHVSICRYFGETIDDKDLDTRRSYCDNMCDVCKHPGRTRQRKQELMGEDEEEDALEKALMVQAEQAGLGRAAEEQEEEEAPVVVVKQEPRGTQEMLVDPPEEVAVERTMETGKEAEAVPLEQPLPLRRTASMDKPPAEAATSLEPAPKVPAAIPPQEKPRSRPSIPPKNTAVVPPQIPPQAKPKDNPKDNPRSEWSTRLDDVTESDEEMDGSDGDNAIRQIVPYQAKLPFPQAFKPPGAAGSRTSAQVAARPTFNAPGPSRPPISTVLSGQLNGMRIDAQAAQRSPPVPIARPSPAKVAQALTAAAASTASRTPGNSKFRPAPSQAGPSTSRPPLPVSRPAPPSLAVASSSRPKPLSGEKRPLTEVEPNTSESAAKRPRNSLADVIRNVTQAGASRGLPRQTSRAAFKPPFAVKPPELPVAQENQPMEVEELSASESSGILDLTRSDSTGPTSDDGSLEIGIPHPSTSNKGKGRAKAVPFPAQDKPRTKPIVVSSVVARPSMSRALPGASRMITESWTPASDLRVFLGKVESFNAKKIPREQRDRAATVILQLLGHVLLQFSGRDVFWEKIGLPEADRPERRDVLQQCAKEVEFDMFQLAATIDGYKSSLQSREAGIRMMRDEASAAWRDGPERDEVTVEARAVVAILQDICRKGRRIVPEIQYD